MPRSSKASQDVSPVDIPSSVSDIPQNNVPEVVKDNRPRKGRGGTHNFPSVRFEAKTPEDRLLVSKLLSEVITEYKQPRVKSDEELAQRINDYFFRCASSGQTPTVEELAMSTGYTIQTVADWEHGKNKGFSPETSVIIKKAKNVLQTFDAKLVVSGKMNFLAYCFRAKNYYGMVDKQEYVVTPNTRPENEFSEEDIIKRYAIPGEMSDSE